MEVSRDYDKKRRLINLSTYMKGTLHGPRITIRYPADNDPEDLGEVGLLCYKNGEFHGIQQRWTLKNRRVLMATGFVKGFPCGLGLYYWESGWPRRVCNYNEKGQLHGICREFDTKGRLTRMSTHANDRELSSFDFRRYLG